MAVLTTQQRKAMPQGEYALPGKRFPLNDADHDEKALQLVGRSEAAGNISASQAATVKAKARAKLAAVNGTYAGKIISAAKK